MTQMPEESAPGTQIRVLLVGADPGEAERVRDILSQPKAMAFEFSQVGAVAEALEEPATRECDLVLLEVAVEAPGGLAALAQVRSRFPDVPVVVYSDREEESAVLAALNAGARGYLVKRELSPRLAVATLAAALGNPRAILQLNRSRERERHLATHDQLTGLPNRMLFNDRLAQALASARRSNTKVAVLFADLDGFKEINDGLGHAVGDGLLRGISRQISSCLRESDTPARVGGDEFAVLLTQLNHEIDAARVADKLLAAIRKPVLFTPQSNATSASIGIATFPRDGTDPDALVNRADIAMYHAKKNGGNRHEFYAEHMNEAVLRRVAIESGLRSALVENQFHLLYQPQYDLRRSCISGAEALIRWQHPESGLMSPARFLPVAEETGLIIPIGEWVLRRACAQAATWYRQGRRAMRVSINVAAQQFQLPGFDTLVGEIVEACGVPPHAIELEITESSLLQDVELSVRTLRRLKEMGIHIAIDDFGTGYSSMSYLKRLSIDVLKIDQSFVQSLATDPTDATITSTIVQMAHGLGLSTIAEGVETLEQLLLLGSYGCSRMQGYLFGAPAPPETLAEWLDNPPFRWVNESANRSV